MRSLPLTICALVGLISCLSAGPAYSQDSAPRSDSESEALALEAEQVLSAHCADAAGGEATKAAESVAAVSEVWARVSARLEQSKKVYLLYWRGVLGQCLSQEDRALDDLQTFVRARQGSELWAGLVADASKRVRRLSGQAPQAPSAKPGIAVGIALGVGAGALGVGAALSWSESQQKAQLIYPDNLEGDELQGAIDAGSQNAQLSTALAVASIASGVGSVLSFVLAATLPSRGRMAAVRPPVMFAGPSGVGLAWEMTW